VGPSCHQPLRFALLQAWPLTEALTSVPTRMMEAEAGEVVAMVGVVVTMVVKEGKDAGETSSFPSLPLQSLMDCTLLAP
jgi:hypothetical protein